MKWFLHGIIKFILEMFNGNNDVSSKRVNGTLCILVVLILLIISVIFGKQISDEISKLMEMVFWGGAALLGLGVAEKWINK